MPFEVNCVYHNHKSCFLVQCVKRSCLFRVPHPFHSFSGKKKWHSHIALFEKKEWHSLITLSLKEYTLLVLPFFFKKFRLKKLSNQQRIQKFEICLDVANGDVSEEKKYIKHNAIITRLIWNSISTKLVSF